MDNPIWAVSVFNPYHETFAISLTLLLMGIAGLSVWIYSLMTLKLSDALPEEFFTDMLSVLSLKKYDKAIRKCRKTQTLASCILAKGIEARLEGKRVMAAAIRQEGEKCANALNKRVDFLQKITISAPLIGTFGFVIAIYFHMSNQGSSGSLFLQLIEGMYASIGPLLLGALVSVLSMGMAAHLKNRIEDLMGTITNELITLIRSVEFDDNN